MISMKNYTLIFLASLLFFSCSPTRYIHKPLIISGLEEKGEHVISGNFATTIDSKNFNINGSYAISNHIILQSSYTFRDDYADEMYSYKTTGNGFDVSLGYTNNTKEKNFYFEGFLGYGIGKINNTNTLSIDSYANFKYNKIFSQLNSNIKFDKISKTNNYFSLHFPIRLEYLNYNKTAINNFSQQIGQSETKSLLENPNIFIWSIGKTLSYNLENVTFSVFGSLHSPTNATSFVTLQYAYVGFGVNFRNFLKRKKN